MKVWVMTAIYDDGDPGDKAHVQTLKAFSTLEAARQEFRTMQARYPRDSNGFMTVDSPAEDLYLDFGADCPEGRDIVDWAAEQAMLEPEKYVWTNGRDDDFWEGGEIVEFHEVEVA